MKVVAWIFSLIDCEGELGKRRINNSKQLMSHTLHYIYNSVHVIGIDFLNYYRRYTLLI